jgi:hypothetical protein
LVAERLVRLAKLVGSENVMAGTDCGFAQGPFVPRPSVNHVGKAAIGGGRSPARLEAALAASCNGLNAQLGAHRQIEFPLINALPGRSFILALVGDRKSRRWMRGSGKPLLHFGLSV